MGPVITLDSNDMINHVNELLKIQNAELWFGGNKKINDDIPKHLGYIEPTAVYIAIDKINDSKILILPRDTKSDPKETLKKVEELYAEGIKIFIGPVFNENLKGLSKFQDVIFLSLTNKILNNPKNVISAGINAKSQFNAIKKYQKLNDLDKTLILIPKKDYKEEIEQAIKDSDFKAKKDFYYDTEPTKLTKQIEKVTRYQIRKQNLEDEIKSIENSDEDNKDK